MNMKIFSLTLIHPRQGIIFSIYGNSEHVNGSRYFKNQIATAVDLNEYLKQIKTTISLDNCPPIFIIPSNKNTMPSTELYNNPWVIWQAMHLKEIWSQIIADSRFSKWKEILCFLTIKFALSNVFSIFYKYITKDNIVTRLNKPNSNVVFVPQLSL